MAIREKDINAISVNRTDRRAVGVFRDKDDVEKVIRALKDADFNMDKVSLLARNVDSVEGSEELRHDNHEGNEASEGAGVGATTGTVLGGVTGFLIGVGVLAIPGVGPVLAAGAEISALGSTLAGAGIGAAAGGIVGALVGLGIPEEKAKVYEDRIKAGDYLLIVTGDENRVNRAESIMRDRHVEEFEIFGPFETDRNVNTHDHATRTTTSTRDLDHDGEPEVIITDERSKTR